MRLFQKLTQKEARRIEDNLDAFIFAYHSFPKSIYCFTRQKTTTMLRPLTTLYADEDTARDKAASAARKFASIQRREPPKKQRIVVKQLSSREWRAALAGAHARVKALHASVQKAVAEVEAVGVEKEMEGKGSELQVALEEMAEAASSVMESAAVIMDESTPNVPAAAASGGGAVATGTTTVAAVIPGGLEALEAAIAEMSVS